jgi:hypothetical protein
MGYTTRPSVKKQTTKKKAERGVSRRNSWTEQQIYLCLTETPQRNLQVHCLHPQIVDVIANSSLDQTETWLLQPAEILTASWAVEFQSVHRPTQHSQGKKPCSWQRVTHRQWHHHCFHHTASSAQTWAEQPEEHIPDSGGDEELSQRVIVTILV